MTIINKLSSIERAAVVRALVEGNSIRATCRITGHAKGTVLSLLNDLGATCSTFQYKTLRGLSCKQIQCDEVWAFCYAKQKNIPESMKKKYGVGDVWTWTALCPDTKLVVSWHVGPRDANSADSFIGDLAGRLDGGRVQVTTDGHSGYVSPILWYFRGRQLDYAQLVKTYGKGAEDGGGVNARYSPPDVIKTKKHRVIGSPDMDRVSTSHVERQNLTMRMGIRRFTRLTNAFSKKIENLESAVALHFLYYNFVRVHQTIGTTPAIAAGVADHAWSIDEIVALLSPTPQLAASSN